MPGCAACQSHQNDPFSGAVAAALIRIVGLEGLVMRSVPGRLPLARLRAHPSGLPRHGRCARQVKALPARARAEIEANAAGGTAKGVKAVVFDWGDTLMRDFPAYNGPMVSWPRVEVVPGVPETLAALYGRVLCCAASNASASDAELMGRALARVGLRGYFQALFTSRELGAAKPDPAFYRTILHRLELQPQECVMVGNDYEKDIVPAKSVGLWTIWLASTPGPGVPVPDADAIIPSMSDLVRALEALVRTDRRPPLRS